MQNEENIVIGVAEHDAIKVDDKFYCWVNLTFTSSQMNFTDGDSRRKYVESREIKQRLLTAPVTEIESR
jgi:hypothetical protein